MVCPFVQTIKSFGFDFASRLARIAAPERGMLIMVATLPRIGTDGALTPGRLATNGGIYTYFCHTSIVVIRR